MVINFFNDVFSQNSEKIAIIWNDKSFSYSWLSEKINFFSNLLIKNSIKRGNVVSLDSTFTPYSTALLFSLINLGCIIIPLFKLNKEHERRVLDIAKPNYSIKVNDDENLKITHINITSDHKLYLTLRERNHPGLVLFTSGSSGVPKAAVHDFINLLNKFKTTKKAFRTLNFLLFDHWGGLNTMFHILSGAGTLIYTDDRSPENICHLIEEYKIEILPTTPTFLNLLLISDSFRKFNLSSLKIISYGTEPMSSMLLVKLHSIFKHVKLHQTYGLIEVGVMRSKSENNTSTWMKIGGENYKTRIVDGILQIKSDSNMLGYLNTKSPITNDGWFDTGDQVEEKGEFFKILGRKSEIINVGGEKVFPAEVENVLQEIDNIQEVTIFGQKNPIVGNIVCAKIRLKDDEDHNEFKKKLRIFCKNRLQKYKIPIKIIFDKNEQSNYRFKKIRT